MLGLGLSLWSSTILGRGADPYGVLGLRADLVFDFGTETYRTKGSPRSFSEAITYTGASNKTMVDSDGLLKWAPHNLTLNSENITGSGWSTLNATATANTIVAPDGALSGDTLTASAATGAAYAQSQVFGIDGYMLPTFAVAVKAGTHNVIQLINTGDVQARANFDISSGTIGSTGTKTTATITPLGDGWFLCKIALDATTVVAFGWRVYLVTTLADGYAATGTWTGTESIYLWGAHLYRSDLGGMVDNPDRGDSYVPTTSSARYLARRGHHIWNGSAWVNEGLLHESEARTNLQTYSRPDTTNWATLGATLTENAAVGFGGELTASRLTGSGVLTTQRTGRNATLTGNACYWFRVRKDSTHGFAQIIQATDGTFFQNFNLTTGALGTAGAGVLNAGVVDEGDFWLLFMAVNAASSGIVYIYLAPSESATYGQSNNTANYIDIDHAQVEAGLVPSSTIPTSGATVTRAADTLTVPSANLPWPTPNVIGSELVTNGTFDTDSDWTKGTGWTISGGAANKTTVDNTSVLQTLTTVTGKVYVVSFDVTVPSASAGVRPIIGATSYGNYNAVGTYSIYFVAAGVSTILYFNGGSFNGGSIDNISVREIDPLAVSIQMQGRATGNTYTTTRWYLDASNAILQDIGSTDFTFTQEAAGVVDTVTGGSFTSGVNTPFNFASTHASTLVAAAVGGTALIDNTTPVVLPNLSATDLNLGHSFMGTLKLMRVWSADITEAGREEAST